MGDFFNNLRRRLSSVPAGFTEVERAERIFYLNYLREKMTVFDVGANVGELTLLFSRFVGENGRIHSFEASRAAFRKLEIVCRTTNRRNVKLNHLGVSDKSGLIRLHVYDDNYLSFNSQAVRQISEFGAPVVSVETEETPAVTIDDYCRENKIEQIDLLKIDVEGAELQVMRGAQQMLAAKKIKCLTFEFGQATFDMGNNAAEIENLLKISGYKIRNLISGAAIFPGRENPENAGFSMHIAVPNKK